MLFHHTVQVPDVHARIVAGTEVVKVTRDEDRYGIRESAEATSLFKLISRRRTRLSVAWRTQAGQPVMETCEHVEPRRPGVKEVEVADGVILHVRGGQAREPEDAVDLFSLMSVSGECEEILCAHIERMGLDLKLVNRDVDTHGERCDHSIMGDGEDAHDAQVRIEEVHGIRALNRIKTDDHVHVAFQMEKGEMKMDGAAVGQSPGHAL